VSEGYRRIGTDVRAIGSRLDNGLTADQSKNMGLPLAAHRIHVATGLIDAHSGGLGLVNTPSVASSLRAFQIINIYVIVGSNINGRDGIQTQQSTCHHCRY
jgi:ribulose kinase